MWIEETKQELAETPIMQEIKTTEETIDNNILALNPFPKIISLTLNPKEVLIVQWLGALAHSRKVAGSIPAHAIGLFRWNLQQIP